MSWLGDGRWNCKCDCGNEVQVLTYNLRNGNTKSCGCYQRQRSSETSYLNIVGKRFGKLVVLERVANDRFGHVRYKCECDCGGFTITDAERLRQGRVQSCGCIKSVGEMKINHWLRTHNVRYQNQYSHDQIILSSGRRPFFDFSVHGKNGELLFLIEFHGKQHYGFSGNGWDTEENYIVTSRRDYEKRIICSDLNIPLYEFNQNDLNYIDGLLNSILENYPEAIEREDSDG